MQQGNALRFRTLSTTQFISAMNQNDTDEADLVVGDLVGAGLGGWGLSAGKHTRGRLRELRVLSVQNLAWAIELWGSSDFSAAGIDKALFLGRWEFLAADGRLDVAGSFYRYWVPGLDLSYQDADVSGILHVRLINLDATAKNAGPTGAIVIEFVIEPTQGI